MFHDACADSRYKVSSYTKEASLIKDEHFRSNDYSSVEKIREEGLVMLEEEEGEEEVLGENRIDPLATPLLLSQKPPVLMEEIDPFEPVERRSVYRRKSFLVEFATSKGPPQIVFLILLVALGAGSTIGVVPAVVSDRYARLLHGYTDPRPCSSYNLGSQPPACLDGSADAQNAVALANLVSNWLTFTTSSMIGSISDERGRRGTHNHQKGTQPYRQQTASPHLTAAPCLFSL